VDAWKNACVKSPKTEMFLFGSEFRCRRRAMLLEKEIAEPRRRLGDIIN